MKLYKGLKLKRELRVWKRAYKDLESELALQKEYSASNLRTIDRLRRENAELYKKLEDKGHFILLAVPKRQTYLSGRLLLVVETREPVITNDIKVSVFDDLVAKGFIRKNREDNNFVIYELSLKKDMEI